jgi:Tat protein translocase TatC
VAERLKAPVLKTGVLFSNTGGSNPSPSVMNQSAFSQVIKEAQVRSLAQLLGFLLSSCVAYLYSEEFLFICAFPMGAQAEFLCTQMMEAFQAYLKVSCLISLYVNAPFLIYQIWCFLIPSCTMQQRRAGARWLLLSATFFYGGLIFAFCFIVPTTWSFFINQCTSSISLFHFELQPRIYDYILLLFRILLFFALCSQVPLFLAWLIKQNYSGGSYAGKGYGGAMGGLWGGYRPPIYAHSHRKKILFLSICVAALLSPPDIWSQLVILFPTYLFIEIVIFYEILLGEYNLVG